MLCRSELGDIAKKILMFSTLLMQFYKYHGIYLYAPKRLERVVYFQSEEPNRNSYCSLNMSETQTKLMFKNNQGTFSHTILFSVNVQENTTLNFWGPFSNAVKCKNAFKKITISNHYSRLECTLKCNLYLWCKAGFFSICWFAAQTCLIINVDKRKAFIWNKTLVTS